MFNEFEAKTEAYKQKNRSEDRVLVLKVMEGKSPITTGGMADKRIFSGEPNLHAIRGPFDNLWRLRYIHGVLPRPFQQSWTSFSSLLDFAKGYFAKRNIEIVEVQDDYSSRYL